MEPSKKKYSFLGLITCIIFFSGALFLHLYPNMLSGRLFERFSSSPIEIRNSKSPKNFKDSLAMGQQGKKSQGGAAHNNYGGVGQSRHDDADQSRKGNDSHRIKRDRQRRTHRLHWLESRQRELKKWEMELTQWEAQLSDQRKELQQKMDELKSLRSQVTIMLKKRVKISEKQIEKLVDFYSQMEPHHAAKIIHNMNEDLAVVVLSHMKKISVAQIMNRLQPKKVQRLSEKFVGSPM